MSKNIKKASNFLLFMSGFIGMGVNAQPKPQPKPQVPMADLAPQKHQIVGYVNEQTPIDMVKITHLLIAGSTGSGKGVALAFLGASLLGNKDNDLFDLLILDAKGGLDYSAFEEDTRCSVITNSNQAVAVLENLREIHNERLLLLKENKCKNLTQYKAKFPNKPIKNVIVIFDELADFINSEDGKDIKQWLKNLIPVTRATGINFILTTQFTKVEVVDSTIKMNIMTKLCLRISGGATASNVVGFESDVVGDNQPHNLKNKGDFYLLKDGEVSDILHSEWKGSDDNQDVYLNGILRRGIITNGTRTDYTIKKNPTALEGLLEHVQTLVTKQKRDRKITKTDVSTFEHGTNIVLAEIQTAGEED